jgi:hypothetical protein
LKKLQVRGTRSFFFAGRLPNSARKHQTGFCRAIDAAIANEIKGLRPKKCATNFSSWRTLFARVTPLFALQTLQLFNQFVAHPFSALFAPWPAVLYSSGS